MSIIFRHSKHLSPAAFRALAIAEIFHYSRAKQKTAGRLPEHNPDAARTADKTARGIGTRQNRRAVLGIETRRKFTYMANAPYPLNRLPPKKLIPIMRPIRKTQNFTKISRRARGGKLKYSAG